MERIERRKPVLDIENTYPEVVRDACSIHAKEFVKARNGQQIGKFQQILE